jgi:hypothetical protein
MKNYFETITGIYYPKQTLREVIRNEMELGPASTFEERIILAIKDFAAQKFGAAYMKAGTDVETIDLLQTLWTNLIKDEK